MLVTRARAWGLASLMLILSLGLKPAITKGGHDPDALISYTVTPERVKLFLDVGEKLLFIDLRPAREFQKRRLPGARSIPAAELGKRYAEIPKTGRVILYCDCQQNELIQDAYQVLKDDHGYRNISIMPEGFKGWLKRKFPTEAGSKTN